MSNALLIFAREVRDQLRDKRTLFMLIVLPLLLYPALGIFMIQATMLFNDKPRNVVVLGADEMPEVSLLKETESGYAIDPRYFRDPEDSSKLNVTTDAQLDRDAAAIVDDETVDAGTREAAMKVLAATKVSAWLAELAELRSELAPLLTRQVPATDGGAEAGPEALSAAETATLEAKQVAIDALTGRISELLATADIQVLIVMPDGFAGTLAEFNRKVLSDEPQADGAEALRRPRPQIVQNTADEKSSAALGRINEAVRNWDKALLAERLAEADLPAEFVDPVASTPLDVARTEERSANVWARLFPFLLILMSVTGAFYPAIDLGAGEKERGTMETLLICPATRGQIVAGKFFTIFAFSLITTVLNIASMGATGSLLTDMATRGMSGLTPPPLGSLVWVLILALPMAAMFSALSLALAMFARSSKEGQYYLTPLVSVTIGLAVFASMPLVTISPFYSVLPVVGPALLLKGLLAPGTADGVLWYLGPVLVSSIGYSVLALWWARDQFNREDILFREADRFELGTWLKQLVTERGETPTFGEALVLFILLMLLQLASLKFLTPFMADGSAQGLMTGVVVQQTLMVALPAVLLGAALTANIRKTFLLYRPPLKLLAAAALLPLLLHPVMVEISGFLGEHFFEKLPDSFAKGLAPISDKSVPLGLAILVIALTPAVCEEIAFRGFILTGASSGRRWTLGIIVSAALFGFIHMVPQQVFNTALLGVVIGILAVRSGSLLPGMLFHFLNNSIAVLHGRTAGSDYSGLPGGDLIIRQSVPEAAIGYGWPLVTFCGLAAAALIVWIARQPVSKRFEKASTVKPAPTPEPLADRLVEDSAETVAV